MNDPLYKKVGYDLMAAAFEVHREQGGGLLEEIYQESFENELERRSIPYSAKQEVPVFYKGVRLRKTYVPDLFVSGGIMVELKAVKELLNEHEAQLLNCMRITRTTVGYLINFAPLERVVWRRFVVTEEGEPLMEH